MIKIFLSVRNRLAITKKCIEALEKHSTIPHQIYVYDNDSNYLIDEHFDYFCEMYKKGIIAQVTFTTTKTTFNAFSKASACNFFGQQHEQDPHKDGYVFLLMLDNDIIVTPEWDRKLATSWKYINKNKLNDIKVVGQTPGGIKNKKTVVKINEELQGRTGKLGGSGLWSVRTNFFDDVGLLNLSELVGFDKKHDQNYWRLLDISTGGKPYILALNQKLGIHCGKMAGSVCNRLTTNKKMPEEKRLELIKFEKAEDRIEKLTFSEFFNIIHTDKVLMADW